MNNPKDELLSLYLNELAFLRTSGVQFARKHRKVASRLELGPKQASDPNVERLIESFAFLTANLQADLKRQFSQIPIALLENLYPHLVQPIPSMAIAQVLIDEPITDVQQVPRGTKFNALTGDRQQCHFQSCYDVELWPIDVDNVELIEPEPGTAATTLTTHALLLRLRSSEPLKKLTGLKRLRFFLGDEGTKLHEAMIRFHTDIQLEFPNERPTILKEGNLRAIGFDDKEAVLPDPAALHPGYRLLQELFTFPDKFLFVDVQIQGEDSSAPHPFEDHEGMEVTLRIGLSRELLISAPLTRKSFRLSCTPVINLFPRTSEPVRLNETRLEYHLIPDSQRLDTTEIHSILQVNETANSEDTATRLEPFFAFAHQTSRGDRGTYWIAQRRETGLQTLRGTFTYLSFADLDFSPLLPATRVIYAHTLCTNRSIATQVNAGDKLRSEGSTTYARCLDSPTPQRDAPVGEKALWNLVAHLTLNQLSLSHPGQGDGRELEALQAILRLHSGPSSSDLQQIQGLVGLETRTTAGRLPGAPWGAYCRGLHITLTYDDASYSGSSAFLLASVLNAFFPLYASSNSFTRLTLTNRNVEGDSYTWPPSHGAIRLL